MSNYSTYETFVNENAALDFIELLNKHNINYELVNNDNIGASFIGFQDGGKKVELKLLQSDFATVDTIIEDTTLQQIDDLDKDYFLLSYTNDELKEIISEPDKWSKFDYYIAKHLLIKRAADVSEESINAIKTERVNELSRPEKNQLTLIILGYLFAVCGIVAPYFLPIFLGIVIGVTLLGYKKALPDGNKVYAFNSNNRMHGLILAILNTIILILQAFTNVLVPLVSIF